MADRQWVMVWHQAMTGSFLDGRGFGWNKTVAFSIEAPVAGTRLRVRLSNRLGNEPARIGALNVLVDGRPYPLTMEGRRAFSVTVGQTCHTDAITVPINRGARLELRLYYLNAILDSNMIEEGATLLKGSRVADEGTQDAVRSIADQLHERGVRMAMQTITPRLGVARTMGKYTPPMEELRLRLNDWIRGSASLFDCLFDAEAVVRERREDGWYFREGIHQGDHLHPNAAGGQLLADAWDLEQLVGA